MTANQLLKFAEEHAHDTDGFAAIEESLYTERTAIIIQLEQDPDSKKLVKQLNDAMEKLEMIDVMKVQRLELFRQSALKE